MTPPPAAKRPTIADVAREAGVSRTTVSHALNDRGQVHVGTRDHVKEVAARLGYRPSVRAQRLRTGRSRTVALLSAMPAAVSGGPSRLGFFTELAVGCAENALTRGYSLVLVPPSEDPAALAVLDIDGAILLEPPGQDPLAAELTQRGVPFVTIGEDLGGAHARPSVDLRHRDVAELLLTHLRAQGARRVGLVLGSSGRQSQETFRAVHRELAEADGVTPVVVTADERLGEDAGYAATRGLLEAHPELDALCVPIDAFASGAARAASEAGRRVGKDLLVATRYDGVRARAARPQLTAVDLHLAEVSRAAVDLLLLELGETAPGPPAQVPAPVLVARASTRSGGPAG
ncbi:LacI family DNA-binding transcriptional regulator [Georgenia sp. Z1491]|uniref:LacI family DNA-binding transcriptional regulator n=1 Tax=Georgenia sp. Z1491 TaxID=3416707 RepID=UPI003CEC6284